MSGRILLGENLELLARFADESFQMIYIDPPFNTGRRQRAGDAGDERRRDGDREGFGGRRYRTRSLGSVAYADTTPTTPPSWNRGYARPAGCCTRPGTLYVHLDYREAHYVKILMDEIFGRTAFLNELIWAYDYGGKPRRRWPAKHDTILVYVRDPAGYCSTPRRWIASRTWPRGWSPPRRSPAESDQPTSSGTRSCRPPAAKRPDTPHKSPKDWSDDLSRPRAPPAIPMLDFFAGSGTLGAVAEKLDRDYVLIDSNPEAIEVMRRRLPEARKRCRHRTAGSVTGARQAKRSHT